MSGNASTQFIERKWLDNVVIAPRSEAPDLVLVLHTGGEEQNWTAHMVSEP